MKKILSFLCIWACTKGAAQNDLCVQGGAVTILNKDGVNPTLFVGGNTAVGSGSITNASGMWQMTGNIANNGTVTSTGTEKFSGSGNQTLSGTLSGTSYLGVVSKENIGNIVLAADLDVNTLAFATDGTIDASSGKTLFVNNTAYNSISGFNSFRYVDVGTTGSLKLKTSDITAGHYYAFPVGNSTAGYRRMDMNLSSLGATGTSTVSAMLVNGSPGSLSFSKHYATGFSGTSGGPCTIGTNDQWVEFNCLQGNYWSFSGPSDYIYVLKAYASGCGSRPNRVIQSPTGTAAWTVNIENTVGAVTDNLCQYTDWSNGTASAIPGGAYKGLTKDFAIAGGSAAALPVRLLDLAATPVDNDFIRIDWTTATETENYRFIVERSEDAMDFRPIGSVPGHGTSTAVTEYSLDDRKADPGVVYYYRLRQVDYDGTETLSQTVSASIRPETLKWDCYPNPSRGTVTLQVTSPSTGTATVQIVNAIGQPVYDDRISYGGGTYRKTLSMEVPNGTYTVKITSGLSSSCRKITVLR